MNKKKIITTASAVALAAMMAFGGTMAYYQGQAEESVANTWVDQGNSVSISESDVDGNGNTHSNTYSIIPGTTDKKDPVVTAEYTLDSYVYVTVDDTTGELIDWDPASAWSLLNGYDDVYYLLLKTISYDESSDWTENDDNTYSHIEDGLTYTYKGTTEDVGSYTVSKDGVEIYTYTTQAVGSTTLYTASIPVIDGDIVTYSSEITNDTFEGYGTTVSLTFDAYIIQAWLGGTGGYGESEYSDEVEAFFQIYYEAAAADGEIAANGVTLYTSLAKAISEANNGDTVTLLSDVSESSRMDISSGKSLTIDLNGHTLTSSSYFNPSGSLTIENGTYISTYSLGVQVKTGGTFTLAENATLKVSYDGTTSSYVRGVYTTSGNTIVNLYGDIIVEDSNATNNVSGIWSAGNATINLTGDVTVKSSGNYTYGIYAASNEGSTVNVNGSTISVTNTADAASYKRAIGVHTASSNSGSNKVVISGDTTITSTSNYYAYGLNASGGEIDISSGSVSVSGKTGNIYSLNYAYGTLNVSGGTFTGPIGSSSLGGSLTITGGNFSSNPISYVDAESYTVTTNDDGTYTVSATSSD